MLCRRHETGLTSLNVECVVGTGDSKGEIDEWSVRACRQVKVLPPAMIVY